MTLMIVQRDDNKCFIIILQQIFLNEFLNVKVASAMTFAILITLQINNFVILSEEEIEV